MNELTRFHDEVEALALQLEKLLKVINHSDPSAENMKFVLYEKYKFKLSDLAERIKASISWSVFNHYLDSLFKNKSLSVADDAKEIVIRKLIKDFESEFVVRHQLSELTPPPDLIDFRQKERIKNIRKQIRSNRRQQVNGFRADDISDMIQFKYQQKTARKSLDKLVKAFSKIDVPETES